MASHTAMIRLYADGTLYKAGEPVEYAGDPDWKYRPNDPIARARWEQHVARPDRVVRASSGDVGLPLDGRVAVAVSEAE